MNINENDNIPVQITNDGFRLRFLGFTILFIALIIQLLARGIEDIKSFEILLLLLLGGLSIYFSRYMDLYLVNETDVILESLSYKRITYQKILGISLTPITSRSFGRFNSIYKIEFLDQNGKRKARLISVPEKNQGVIDKIMKQYKK